MYKLIFGPPRSSLVDGNKLSYRSCAWCDWGRGPCLLCPCRCILIISSCQWCHFISHAPRRPCIDVIMTLYTASRRQLLRHYVKYWFATSIFPFFVPNFCFCSSFSRPVHTDVSGYQVLRLGLVLSAKPKLIIFLKSNGPLLTNERNDI